MSIARTARRRRRQYAMGPRGTEQIFGKSAAPHYAPKLSAEQSAAPRPPYWGGALLFLLSAFIWWGTNGQEWVLASAYLFVALLYTWVRH